MENSPAPRPRFEFVTPAARAAVLFGTVAYVVLALFFQYELRTSKVYNHFAYLPIVLAALLWGRRAIFLALGLAGINTLIRIGGSIEEAWWNDVVRTLLFLAVAVFTGLLSERLQREHEKVRQTREDYARLLEGIAMGLIVYERGRVLFANSALKEMFGFPEDEIRGRSPFDFVADEDRERVRSLAASRSAQDQRLRYECRVRRRDGEGIWVHVTSIGIQYQGRPAVLVGLFDLTELKQAESESSRLRDVAQRQEEQLIHSTRLAELGEMAATIAHEINQPLTGIRNFARNAEYMIDNDAGTIVDVRDNLRMISEQVDRASRVIGRMRELSRKSERELAMLDLNAVLRESLQFLRPQLSLSGVETVFDPSPELPRVLADRIRLEQVFLNLITNARQSMTERDERRLSVRTRFDDDARLPIRIEIEDTGEGFDSDTAEKIFQPFFTTKPSGHGTGLGLSISSNIIKDHRGEIEARSEPGRGSCFTVRLPMTAD